MALKPNKAGIFSRNSLQFPAFPRRGRRLLAAVCMAAAIVTVTTLFPTYQALAQISSSVEDMSVDSRHVNIIVNKSRTIKFETPFSAAVVGNPGIADVLPMSDRVVYIQGKKTGTTNVSVFDKKKQLTAVLDITVTLDTTQIKRSIVESIGNRSIRVTVSENQIVLSGMARDAEQAAKAVAIAQAMVSDKAVVNAMKIAPSQQVMLKVRFLEVNRQAAREIGVNWYGSNQNGTQGMSTGLSYPTQTTTRTGGAPVFQPSGLLSTFASGTTSQPFGVAIANIVNSGGVNIDAMISMLEKRDLVRSLAEPDLVALSGDKASFKAGGQIPVPVPQMSSSGTIIVIEWKDYGVELEFLPTVLSQGVINMSLHPKVSDLDYSNAVQIVGYTIPAVTNRETNTVIELRDGQSFAISGLLQHIGKRNIAQLPWLGSLPVLGALFRSSSYQQKETELVVIATPHLVRPAAPGQHLASPLDERMPPNDVDFFLEGRTDLRKKYTKYVNGGGKLKGPYGHLLPRAASGKAKASAPSEMRLETLK
jgi:pilus assembly protein CpaC